MRKLVFLLVIAALIITALGTALAAPTVRIKDIAKVQGVRSNQLVGYGLVVGLNGTGDSDKTSANPSVANILKSFGVTVNTAQLKAKNVAAVMITAQLPPFVKSGDNIDITVSSIGDAKSLQGGTLLQAPLQAANGNVYAVAQGALSTGGFSAGRGGNSQQKNFPTVGSVPNGAIVERDVPMQISAGGTINLALAQPDFTTATRITEAINVNFGAIAYARDPGTVAVTVPYQYGNNVVAFVASLEDLPVTPDAIAKIVINERTGTVVMGANVAVSEAAVAQGGLSIKISRETQVSQPPSFSDGTTAVTEKKTVEVDEKPANLIVLPSSSNIGDVVNALNAVGATPRDIIAILQAMKAAGALHADLQII